MKIKYFVESAYMDLFDSIKEHEELYTGTSNEWVKEFFKDKLFFKESRIDSNLPELDPQADEYTNVISFYGTFRGKLNPKQASK